MSKLPFDATKRGSGVWRLLTVVLAVSCTALTWQSRAGAITALGGYVSTDESGGSNTSHSVTLTTAIPAGQVIIASLITNETAGAVTCSDNASGGSNTYTNQFEIFFPAGTPAHRLFVCYVQVVNPLAIGDKVTVTYPASGSSALSVDVFSGIAAPPEDVSSSLGSSTAASSGPATSAGAALFYGSFALNALQGDTFTPDGGYTSTAHVGSTLPPGPPSRTIGTAYQIVGAGTTDDAGATLSPSSPWAASVLVFASTGVCGDGTQDAGEACDEGANNGTPGFCCSSLCALLPTSTVCRAAAVGGCDVAENCDGTNGTCPADAFVSPTNFATAGTAMQSTDCGAECAPGDILAANANDGNTDGAFANGSVAITSGSEVEPYWQVDLGAVQSIGAIEVWNRLEQPGRLNNFHVFVSDVAFTGTTVAASMAQVGVSDFPFAGAAGATEIFQVNRTGRYVRVQLTSTSQTANGVGSNYLQLAEVRVLGVAVCRGSAGTCDIVENCTGSSATCDADAVLPAATVCRAAVAGGCDIQEVCDGTLPTCPADVVQPAATVCRPAVAGGCDIQEVCNGTSNACPPDAVEPTTTVCRSLSAGGCDIAENCNGSNACPADAVQPTTFVCRPAVAGGCDIADTCDGTTKICPADAVQPAATVCRAAVPGGCDIQEVCNGTLPTCPADAVQPAATVCRAAVAGGCDIQEVCNGTSNACPPDAVEPTTTVCRPAVAGGCDIADKCNGSNMCPADAVQPSTTVCRPAAAGGCDIAESCTGTTATCPTDVMQLASFVCRASGGECDLTENCPGGSVTCPADAKQPLNTPCTPDALICTNDVCDGSGNACTHPPTPDSDVGGGDGVCDTVEDGAPNGGDGNNDGMPDKTQCNVASLPTATDFGYMTAITDCGCLTMVTAYTEAQVGNDQPYAYPFGLLGFMIPTCTTANITVYYHDGENFVVDGGYRKYGPTTPGVPSTTKFYTLPGVAFATVNIPGPTDPVLRATFQLNDGVLGDTALDGKITDPGGPAITDLAQVAPVVSPSGLAAMVLLLSVVAAFGIWRSRASMQRQ